MKLKSLVEVIKRFLKTHAYCSAAVVFLIFFFGTYLLFPLLGVNAGEASETSFSRGNRHNESLRSSFSSNGNILRTFGKGLKEDKEKSDVFRIIQSHDTGLMKQDERDLAGTIVTESKKYNQDPFLTLAIIMTESTFYNWSRSHSDAHGLMQIRTRTGSFVAKELGVYWEGRQTLFDPFVNIRFGTYYFNKMMGMFKSRDIALAAYNIGPTKVRKLLSRKKKVPMRYSRKVKNNYAKLIKIVQVL